MSCPEQLLSLEAFWQLKRGDRALPCRRDFNPEELRPWLGNIAIVAVERDMEHGPDLRFRVTLSGSRLDEYRGYGITGRYIHALTRDRASTLPYYEACVAERQPVRFLHDNSLNSAIYRCIAKLLLPLSEDGRQVDRILVGLYPVPANTNDPGRACVA